MNNLEMEYRQGEWVEQTSPRPGKLWKHTPAGYFYFDRSDLMAFYDTGAQPPQWKIYDYRAKQWYVYSEALFFCQTPVVGGVCQAQPQPSISNIVGEYNTTRDNTILGIMTLRQTGNVVTGTYPNGRIEGTVTDRDSYGRVLLVGKWFEASRQGKIEFLFNADLQFWGGYYGIGEGQIDVTKYWTGRRIR